MSRYFVKGAFARTWGIVLGAFARAQGRVALFFGAFARAWGIVFGAFARARGVRWGQGTRV